MARQYETEEDFLKDYDQSLYDRMAIVADILLFSVSSEETTNYRKTDKKMMSILLIKRKNFPFKDRWCLPGGFVRLDEDLDESPKRVLKEETGLDGIYLEQLYTFGEANRDPRMRIISTSYMALVDKTNLKSCGADASWFDVSLYEEKNGVVDIVLDDGQNTISFSIRKRLREHTTDRYSFETIENEYLAFDNDLVIVAGLERLKNKLEYTDIVFNMMPKYFTLGELQQVYEVILGKKLLDPAFRRIIANKVSKTDKIKSGKGHRPSALYTYKKDE